MPLGPRPHALFRRDEESFVDLPICVYTLWPDGPTAVNKHFPFSRPRAVANLSRFHSVHQAAPFTHSHSLNAKN